MTARELVDRLKRRDPSLWPDGNVSLTRLGWLDAPARYAAEAADLAAWAATVEAPRIVLLGMGGSSLGPEVLRAFAASERLVVLDTTDPRTIAAAPFEDALVLVSSKSGGTLEVKTLLAYAWDRLAGDASRFVAITDPGTELAKLAADRGFARVFENDPNIGGRYSVLSYFGLVPAALLGYDVGELCRRALAADALEAADLGLAMAAACAEGRDKVTIRTAPTSASFGLWIEQLIAESTGKLGKGCVPVPTCDVEEGSDRFELAVPIGEAHDLGEEFFRWEIATAVAGHAMAIDPFDEPNVTESKENTQQVLSRLPLPEIDAMPAARVLSWLQEAVQPGDYVSLQAFLPYDESDALAALRTRVRDALGGMAVTAGLGPRFLHSTGQLHKGGANNIVAVQLVPSRPTAALAIPGFDYDFGTLIAAQAQGDYESLATHGRRVARVAVDHIGEVS